MQSREPEQLMTRPRVAAGALFFDDNERILCVQPSYKDSWDIPGGYVEHDESPRAACVREVREELGISPPVGALLVVDWAPHPREGDKLLFIFDGGTLVPEYRYAVRLDEQELTDYAYLTLEQAESRVVDRLARRVTAAVHAHSIGRPAYLEHGEPIGVALPK